MQTPLVDLLDTLRGCATVEQAGVYTLRALASSLQRAMDQGAFGRGAQILRILLHRHEGQGFSAGSRLELAPGPAPADAPASRTAWDVLQRGGDAIVLDLTTREIRARGGDVTTLPVAGQRSGTVTRLRAAAVTHVLVLPMRAPGRGLAGMVCLELRAPAAAGQDPALDVEDLDEIQALADLGLLGMLALPPARAEPDTVGVNGSAAMRSLLDEARLLAQGGEALLICGPRGSGKTWLASWLHEALGETGPFERLASAHLSAPLLTAALAAEQGTVFLDDLDQLSAPCQAVLTRWLETRAARPRLLLATHEPLVHLTRTGRTRPELARALGTWAVTLPALSARCDEIPALARYMLDEHLRAMGETEAVVGLGRDASERLRGAAWPEHLSTLRAVVRLATVEAKLAARRSGRAVGPVTISASDVAVALERASPRDQRIVELLRPGARALAERAIARPKDVEPLKLALAEGLSGLVLAETLEQGLSVAEAADALGLAHQRADGNHWKTLRGAADKLSRLCEALGEEPPPSLAAVGPRWRQRS